MYIKDGWGNYNFWCIEIEKCTFHNCKNLILLEDVGIDNIVISTMVYSSKNNYTYFVGYKGRDIKLNHYA